MTNSASKYYFIRCFMIIGSMLALSRPGDARAETTVLVQPSLTGGMLVSAGNMYGVTSGEIKLDYITDSPAVAPNVVVMGNNTQATLINSSDTIGTIVIRITGRKPGNGYINLARINLVDQNGNPGRIIPPYTAIFTKDNGGQEAARVEITNPAPADKKTDDTLTIDGKKMTIAEAISKRQQELAARQAAASEGETPARETVTHETDEHPRETVVLVASPFQPQATTKAKLALPEFRRVEGVLDRFRSYGGAWNQEVVERLFAPLDSHEFRQYPAVMIADGLAEVQVSVRSAKVGDVINCLVIRGGQVTSVQPGEAGEWLLTIVPGQGALEVTVTVLTEQNIIEYPLTVASPLVLFDTTAAVPFLAEFVKAANNMVRSGNAATALKK
jgi:hypothetical protein